MYPYPFSYHRPATVSEALQLIGEYGDDGKVLAGGHSLLPVMKLRLAQPGHLVDITGLVDLRGVTAVDGGVSIGALTTHHDILTNPNLVERFGLLTEMAHVVGDQQVRNRGTIGGTLAHADPAADYPAGILALDATIIATGPDGEREIPASEFFTGFLQTAIEPNELITAIRVADLPDTAGYRYEKLANPASGYAIVGVAAIVDLAPDGNIASARIGITGASDVAWRASATEEALVGVSPDDDATIKAAAALATEERELLSDIHAPADYRARVTKNLVFRAIRTASARAAS